MPPASIRRIAITTGGGDAPGLNAVIRATVRCADGLGWEVYGIERGYDGLLTGKGVSRLTRATVRGIGRLGGTILGTTNKGNPFRYPVRVGARTVERDVSDLLLRNFRKWKIDALIAIGGDGSLSIAEGLAKKGLKVVGVPKTIDNDLEETVVTFGFDTAVSTATEAIDKLQSTALSHERVMVVELMGRNAGWIALNAGIAGGADIILIPEIPFRLESVCKGVQERWRMGRNFCIIVAAEGAAPAQGTQLAKAAAEAGGNLRLGGIGEWLAKEIQARTRRESRSLVLGHLQRGGSPTTFDRLIATRFGAAAVRFIQQGLFGHMVALRPPEIIPVSLAAIAGRQKKVPLDCDTVVSARAMGIRFGDEVGHRSTEPRK